MIRAALALALLCLAAPRTARADAHTEALAHTERAFTLHREGRFAEALNELTTSYALEPRPELLYAIAQTHVQLGDCARAITFYQRFLSTRPARVAADAAREAIDVCAQAPPPPVAEPAPPPVITEPAPPVAEPAPPVAEPAPPVALPPPPARPAARAWYRDPVGLALVGGGVLSGVAGGVAYGLARADLDDAEAAPTYAAYADLVERGHDKRLAAGVLAGAGVALTAIGVYRLWRHDRAPAEIALVPTRGGGVVSWAGRF